MQVTLDSVTKYPGYFAKTIQILVDWVAKPLNNQTLININEELFRLTSNLLTYLGQFEQSTITLLRGNGITTAIRFNICEQMIINKYNGNNNITNNVLKTQKAPTKLGTKQQSGRRQPQQKKQKK